MAIGLEYCEIDPSGGVAAGAKVEEYYVSRANGSVHFPARRSRRACRRSGRRPSLKRSVCVRSRPTPHQNSTSKRLGFFVMWYVYVLESERTGRFYKGCTNDITRRLSEHNAGSVIDIVAPIQIHA